MRLNPCKTENCFSILFLLALIVKGDRCPMKLHLIVLPLLVVLFTGCRSMTTHRPYAHQPVVRTNLTPYQWEWIRVYRWARGIVTDTLKLPRTISSEEVRVNVARLLHAPENTSWETILVHPSLKQYVVHLTESRRLRMNRIFELPPDTSWVDLMRFAEYWRMRTSLDQKKTRMFAKLFNWPKLNVLP